MNRETIYTIVDKFCKENVNTYLHDPSMLIKENTALYDNDTHFTLEGFDINLREIYKLIKSI